MTLEIICISVKRTLLATETIFKKDVRIGRVKQNKALIGNINYL